jgi:hypothetical protein
MVTMYTFKVINLFYLTKVKVLFRVCLGEVQAFKIELHTNDIGFPFIHLMDLDLFQEFLFWKTYT